MQDIVNHSYTFCEGGTTHISKATPFGRGTTSCRTRDFAIVSIPNPTCDEVSGAPGKHYIRVGSELLLTASVAEDVRCGYEDEDVHGHDHVTESAQRSARSEVRAVSLADRP